MTVLSELDGIKDAITSLTGAIGSLSGAVSTNSCGCPVGEGLDSDGGDTTTPPTSIGSLEYTAPDPGIADRKCKAANYIWESVDFVLDTINDNNLVALTGGSLSAMVALVTGVIAITGPFGPILLAVAGLVISLAILLLTVTIDSADMVSEWNANKSDIICAMYFAMSGQQAKDDIEAILNGTGLAAVEKEAILLMIPLGLVGLLFGETAASDEFFSTFVAVFDCSTCTVPSGLWDFTPEGFFGVTTATGKCGTGTILNDGSTFTVNAIQRTDSPTEWILSISVVGTLSTCQFHDGEIEMVTSVSGTHSTTGRRCINPGSCGLAPAGQNPGNGPGALPSWTLVMWQKTSPFSVDFKVNSLPTACP